VLIFKDTVKLNDEFPFEFKEYTLKKEDNVDDSYHYHDFCEITYVKSGKGLYMVNGSCYDLTPGDIIIFNNVEPHGWQVVDNRMEVSVITFAASLVSDPGNVFSGEYLKPFIERGSNFQNRIKATDSTTHIIKEIMDEIKTEISERESGYKNMVKADMLRILTYLIRYYQTDDDQLIERKKNLKRLEPALFYLNSHYTEAIKLEDVSKIVYMSPNYFSTYFKKATGRSLVEYVNLLRLKRVRELYLTTDRSMADLAMECGFRNISNFYRIYKKYLGELPNKS